MPEAICDQIVGKYQLVIPDGVDFSIGVAKVIKIKVNDLSGGCIACNVISSVKRGSPVFLQSERIPGDQRAPRRIHSRFSMERGAAPTADGRRESRRPG